jgi:hypothetical protein
MKYTLFTLLSFFAITSMAQITTPQPSPLSTLEQKVGLTDCKIVYSRPSAKGRVIFGDLVPFDVMWRTGANMSTKISFSSDVKIAGKDLPKGEYALYTIPGKTEWTIIFHKNLTYGGTGGDKYTTDEDALRVNIKSIKYPTAIETFTLGFSDITATSANVELLWENTQVNIPVTVDYDADVMKQIESAMKISGNTYYSAARYYLDNDKDLNQALVWMDKALEDGEKYWMLRQKSLMLAKLGRYKEAIAVAEKSKTLATEAKNNDYVKMNTESIAEWKKKK